MIRFIIWKKFSKLWILYGLRMILVLIILDLSWLSNLLLIINEFFAHILVFIRWKGNFLKYWKHYYTKLTIHFVFKNRYQSSIPPIHFMYRSLFTQTWVGRVWNENKIRKWNTIFTNSTIYEKYDNIFFSAKYSIF